VVRKNQKSWSGSSGLAWIEETFNSLLRTLSRVSRRTLTAEHGTTIGLSDGQHFGSRNHRFRKRPAAKGLITSSCSVHDVPSGHPSAFLSIPAPPAVVGFSGSREGGISVPVLLGRSASPPTWMRPTVDRTGELHSQGFPRGRTRQCPASRSPSDERFPWQPRGSRDAEIQQERVGRSSPDTVLHHPNGVSAARLCPRPCDPRCGRSPVFAGVCACA